MRLRSNQLQFTKQTFNDVDYRIVELGLLIHFKTTSINFNFLSNLSQSTSLVYYIDLCIYMKYYQLIIYTRKRQDGVKSETNIKL